MDLFILLCQQNHGYRADFWTTYYSLSFREGGGNQTTPKSTQPWSIIHPFQKGVYMNKYECIVVAVFPPARPLQPMQVIILITPYQS